MKPFTLLLLLPGCVPINILPTRQANTDTVYSPPPMFDQPTVEVKIDPASERKILMDAIAKELGRTN